MGTTYSKKILDLKTRLEKYLVLKNWNVKLPLPFAYRVTPRATAGLLLIALCVNAVQKTFSSFRRHAPH
jgi:hypothetical protein